MIESKKQTSRENARYSNKILRQGLRRVIVVFGDDISHVMCEKIHVFVLQEITPKVQLVSGVT